MGSVEIIFSTTKKEKEKLPEFKEGFLSNLILILRALMVLIASYFV